MDEPRDATVPAWVRWTVRAFVTLGGTTAAVLVATYAGASGQALDVVLVAVIIAATVVAVARPDRPVPVMANALLSMLGLALLPPLWIVALVAPGLLWAVRRRTARAEARRARDRARSGSRDLPPYRPGDAPDLDPPDRDA